MKDQFQVMISCSRSHAGISFLRPCRWDAERVKAVFLICLVFIALSLCMSMYLCPDQVCGARSRSSMDHRYMRLGLRHVIRDNAGKSLASLSSNPFESSRNKLSFDQLLMNESFSFNIKKNDVIVFLHIQKTGKNSSIMYFYQYVNKIIVFQVVLPSAVIWFVTWISMPPVSVKRGTRDVNALEVETKMTVLFGYSLDTPWDGGVVFMQTGQS